MKLREAFEKQKSYFVDNYGKVIKAGDHHQDYAQKIIDDKYSAVAITEFIHKAMNKGWIKIRTTHMEADIEYVKGKPSSKAFKVAFKEIIDNPNFSSIYIVEFNDKHKIINSTSFSSIEEFLGSKLAKRYLK